MRFLPLTALLLVSATPIPEMGTCEGVLPEWFYYDHPTKPAVYPDIRCRPGDRPVWTESEVYCK